MIATRTSKPPSTTQPKMGNTESSEQKMDYLRGIFPSTTPDEQMMQEYSCALFREIHIHGRMYITNKSIYFCSNILGWKTQEAIPLANVDQITRQYSIDVIPNSIEITTTDGEKFFFTSLSQRENAYVILNKVLQDNIAQAQASMLDYEEEICLEVNNDDDGN